ncbi:hypothetical protein AGMMS50230_22170 [Spirochaetia bacterium]|nr:hypothetical protein AGMMS50230_22170 [Spirochaetia bacterium]
MLTVLKDFRIVDEKSDFFGSVIAEDGIITKVYNHEVNDYENDDLDFLVMEKELEYAILQADCVLRGGGNKGLVLMPSFVDLHAHFRDPGFPEKETLESACLAAARGGFGTVVCMANTRPVIDTIEAARKIKHRAGVLGLIDLYPVLSLTKEMEGKELSEITSLSGKDTADIRL